MQVFTLTSSHVFGWYTVDTQAVASANGIYRDREMLKPAI